MTKPTTIWTPTRPGTISVSSVDVEITTESAVTITTQAGVTLIKDPNTFTPKPTTVWA